MQYDIVIIGGGPSGLTAGIYGKRENLDVLLLEKVVVGGQLFLTSAIENYPGLEEPISGFELAEKLKKQAEKFKVKIVTEEVKRVDRKKESDTWQLTTDKSIYDTLVVIVATGAKRRKLGVGGEDKLIGKGVSYCAVCDGPFFKDKKLIVVGGSNTAVKESLFLTKFTNKVTLVHQKRKLRSEEILQRRLFKEKVEILWKSRVNKILGENNVEGVIVEDIETKKLKEIPCDGVFIFIGLDPNTEFIRDLLKVDRGGYIITNENMATSQKGIFACGDCRKKPFRQIVTACGDGAVAGVSAFKYIEEMKGIKYQ